MTGNKMDDLGLDYWMRQELTRSGPSSLGHSPSSSSSLRSLVDSLSFSDKFNSILHNASSESLALLVQLEMHMRDEMQSKIRARNWELEELTKKCEQAMLQSHGQHEQRQFNQLNDRLKQVHAAYAVQIRELSEKHRTTFRVAVDSLHSHNSIPAAIMEEMNSDTASAKPPSANKVNFASDIDESYTVYIGSQLKSLHNVRLQSTPTLVDLCRLNNSSEEECSRLQNAMHIYSRSLSAVVLLVSKDPLFHARHNTDFFRLCEQSTELHFDGLEQQLEANAQATRKTNAWRLGDEAAENVSDSLEVGDVYCTTHSNLHNMQVAFHLVVDDALKTSDIQSRNPCLNGLRNIVRLSARLGISTLHIPLLFIDQPSEATTVAWCLKRAEIVFKCVKGYLIEVCSSSNQHYNLHFVVPSGLAPSIYIQISQLLPTIFHLVPSISSNQE